jgi:hypothetical protein
MRTSTLVEYDFLGLNRLYDESHGAGKHISLALDLFGERQLIQRPHADLLRWAVSWQRARTALFPSVSCVT